MHLFPTDNFRSTSALARFVLTAVVALGADLWTKHHAFQTLVKQVIVEPDGQVHLLGARVVKFIPGFLHFEPTANRGAVFGLGQGMGLVFVGVSLGAVLFLSYLFAHSGRQRLYQIILGMLLAGVLGNMYDRLQLGFVRDMIHLVIGPDLFPWIFNVADVLLCVGVGLMLIYSLFAPGQPRTGPKAAPAPEKS